MKKQHILFLDFLFISILIFLLGFSYLSYKRIEKLKTASDWVSHSTLVKLKLNQTLIHVLDAETGLRGYLLTNDSSFLAQYNYAFSKADADIADVILLTSDNNSQRENAVRLQRYIKAKLEILNSLIRFRGSKEFSSEGMTQLLKSGKLAMDSTRTTLNGMLASEDQLLRVRVKEKQNVGSFTPIFVLLFSVFAIIFVITAYIKLRSETHLRMNAQNSEASVRKLQQESTVLNALLERKVKERTQELQKKNILLENMNDELLSFNYVASHDLQEPLRKTTIQELNATNLNP